MSVKTIKSATVRAAAITKDGFGLDLADVEYEEGCTCAQPADCGPGVGGPHSDMGPSGDLDERMPWEREQKQERQTREAKQPASQTRAGDDFDLGTAVPYDPNQEQECDACQ